MSERLARGASSAPPPTVSGVLRAALALVRRRAALFAVLAVVLSVLPDVAADLAAGHADPAALDSLDDDVADMVRSTLDHVEDVLPVLLATVLDAIVVVIALRGAAAPSLPVPRFGRALLRLVPLAAGVFLLHGI